MASAKCGGGVLMDFTKTAEYDHIEKVRDLINQGKIAIDGNGKLAPNMGVIYTSNWLLLADESDKRKCDFYRDVVFDLYGFIHSNCQECWKVVARPKTLKDLMTVKAIQWELGFKGKCGIDTRPYTFGPYGAYWYCDSPQEGLDRLDTIREALKDLDISITLKRGCTEMENQFSPSSTWAVTNEQKEMEAELDNVYDYPTSMRHLTEYVKLQIMRKWIEKAHEIGDATCFEYSSGPLGVACQNYEREK